MKNQYFGDIRDLFKYDLITQIMKRVGTLRQFTYIPMLTPNDNKNDGNERDFSKAKVGFKNKCLVKFLKSHELPKEKRNIRVIEKYFADKNIGVKIYDRDKNGYFNQKERSDYFKNIKRDLLTKALVLIDPDNGLEVKRNSEKHLLYNELKDILNNEELDDESIIMIFQYFPLEPHDIYVKRRLLEIKKISSYVTYISDNNILFFFLGENCERIEIVKEVLQKYVADYTKCFFG